MIRTYIIILLFLSAGANTVISQQVQDTTRSIPVDTGTQKNIATDTGTVAVDSLMVAKPILDTAWRSFPRQAKSFKEFIYGKHAVFAFTAKTFVAGSDLKHFEGKEILFYLLIALLLIFAFLKTAFAKYLADMFRLFFRRTLKQRQITEQLSQTPLPSLLFNSFFMIIAGLYIAFLLEHFNVRSGDSFWILALYSATGIGIVYLCKFIVLKFTGWVLNMSGATDAYIFVVFIINKIIGIFLLPFLILLAFTQGNLYQVALTLSWCGIACLFFYRFILTYSAVRNQIRVKPFHFVLYLCAFELLPLALIYKLLLQFLQ